MKSTKIHPLLEDQKIFLSAGVFDVLSAKIAEQAGFSSVVLSGYAAAASYLGEPNFGLLTQTEMLDLARRICRAVNIRVIVDGDTGYGSALNVIRMVQELVDMRAGGIKSAGADRRSDRHIGSDGNIARHWSSTLYRITTPGSVGMISPVCGSVGTIHAVAQLPSEDILILSISVSYSNMTGIPAFSASICR